MLGERDGRACVLRVGDAHTACSKEVSAPVSRDRPACICWVMLVLMLTGGPAACLDWLLTAGSAGCLRALLTAGPESGGSFGPQFAESCSHAT